MTRKKNSFSFIVVGKTQESTEGGSSFKRYVGLGSTYVKAVNPSKKDLDAIMGFESANEPEYIKEGENGKEVHIHFIVETDPKQCNGIDIKNRLMFILRQAPAYNNDETKVQIIDGYGNHVWANTEDARAGKKILSENGNPRKIDDKYRIACVGECDLIDFLKAYLCIPDAFNYVNGVWTKKDNPDDARFALEHLKDYFSGNFSELKEAIELQPNNKVKLLYGVRTNDEGKQFQVIASRGDLILRNSAGANAIAKLERNLTSAKDNGAYSTTEFKVQELAEYNVEATNLEKPAESSSSNDMPWD